MPYNSYNNVRNEGNMPTQELLVKNLKVSFATPVKELVAVRGISYQLNQGETLALVGESGCGKTVSALSILRLIEEPPGKIMGGEILFNGKDLLKLTKRELQVHRGKDIAMVFQDPTQSLNPVKRIGKQFVIVLQKRFGYSIKRACLEACDWLDKVQISNPDNILNRFPHQLSGGQMQRIMIAISMAVKPEFLIADEATTALDANIKLEIIELINSLRNEMNTTVLFISHDLLIARRYCDRIAVMNKGRIVEINKTIDIFSHPKHVYTKTLICGLHKLMGKSHKKEEQAEKKILMSVKNIKKTYTANKENLSLIHI